MVTTSHDPSVKLKQFAKEMKLIFPNSKRINRGNTEMPGLINECRKNNFTDLVVFHETRGKPDGMIGQNFGCRADRFTIVNAIHNFVNAIHKNFSKNYGQACAPRKSGRKLQD